MNIIGTGLSGLVGSRVVELLRSKHQFTNISLETGTDITNKAELEKAIVSSDAPIIFHFAAATDVDSVEKEKSLGVNGNAWKVNVEATAHIADLCKKTGKKLLYISTDYVFSGKKEKYSEEDTPDPVGWYGVTKYEGEKAVKALGQGGLIIRIANPYRAAFAHKSDFVRRIIDRLSKGERIRSPYDQIFVPTFIDDIAFAIDVLIGENACGLFHVVGANAISPFDACLEICTVFSLPGHMVEKTVFAEYFKGRAERPLHAHLGHVKIAKYNVIMKSFHEGLSEMKRQLEENTV